MIEVKQLTKELPLSKAQRKQSGTTDKVTKVVNDVSFSCQPGRVFTLLGPNGAGKTTTLRMIASILKPTSGSVQVAGFDIQKQRKQALAKMGFLTGSTGLYDRLSANEIVRYFADLFHVSRVDFKSRKEKFFDLLDMNDFAGKKFGQLSTGMKQKVSIVRALIHDPDVVVFDEPTSGLDVITAEHIITLIRDLKARDKTVIFSSHIMAEVELLCDDLAIIHKGQLIFSGSMDQFRDQMEAKSLTHEFIRRINEANSQNA